MSTQTDPLHTASSSQGADASGNAQAKVQEAAGRVQEQAQTIAGQTQDRVREQVDQRSTQLGEQIHQHASDLRSVSEALRERGSDRPAQAADRLAGYAEQAGSYLRDKDADSLLGDAEEFARQKPAAVAAGALLAGFMASRFLKASSSRRYSARETPRRPVSPAAPPTTASPVPPVRPTAPPLTQPEPTDPVLRSSAGGI